MSELQHQTQIRYQYAPLSPNIRAEFDWKQMNSSPGAMNFLTADTSSLKWTFYDVAQDAGICSNGMLEAEAVNLNKQYYRCLVECQRKHLVAPNTTHGGHGERNSF